MKTSIIKIMLQFLSRFAILLGILCHSAAASTVIRHIGIEDGLSGDRIFSVTQDKDGFIWAVSYWGVDRFDGRIVKTYNPKHNGNAITHLLYHTKIHSSDNRIILGEQNGLLFEYNPKMDDFIEIGDLRHLTGEADLIIKDFCPTPEGIYIATNHGLYNYHGKYLHSMSQREDISAIGKDGRGHIYYVANGNFIYLNKNKTRTIANLEDVARFILADGSNIYIGTNDKGLFIWNITTQKLVRSNASFPKCHLTAATLGNDGSLIIGTDGAGCFLYDTTGDSVIANYSESIDGTSIGNAVMDVLQDRDSNIWVATFNGALSMIHHTDSRFRKLDADYRMPGLGNSFLRAKNGNLWIAGDNGILEYNPESTIWRHHLKDRPEKSIITSLAEDKYGNIWAAGFGCGIYSIGVDYDVNHYTTKSPLCGKPLESDYIAVIRIDGNNLWAGAYSDGNLMRFNLEDKTSAVYNVPDVHSLVEVDPYTVVCGQSIQFTILNPMTNDTTVIKDNVSITDMAIIGDYVWLATDGKGLMTYQPESGERHVITELEENSDFKYIMALCDSPSDSCLYFTTHKQLYKYSYHDNTIIGFGDLMGLPAATYNERAIEIMQPGSLFLGASNGVTKVDIDNELVASSTPHIYLTEFKVAYDIIKPQTGSSILPESLNTIRHINLNHDQNSFSIGFSMVEYATSQLTELQYTLEGFDSKWIDANDFNANYTNVPPGKYVFKLRLCDRNSGNVLSERRLNISVAKPIWSTWWMFVLYACLSISLVLLSIKLIKDKFRHRYSDEKMRLFTEIAHELRTPLALIKAPLSELADNKNLTHDNMATLEIAIRNTDRLQELTTQLMDFQKLDAKAMILNTNTVDLLDFMTPILAPWEYRAKQKGLRFKTEINAFRGILSSIDCQKMGVILGNLLSNAIKYTNEGEIQVNAMTDNSHYLIEIHDTGIGIPANEQRHLFRQFFRAQNARKSNESGTGIGLMLTQRLVELHGGTIAVSSKENIGTIVTLKFPIVRENNDIEPDRIPEHKTISDETILLVEDNADMREILKKTLESNYNIVTAKDGNEAIEKISADMPDIIVSDLMMPDMTGKELCRRLKNDITTSHIPFILLTAVVDHETKTSAFECGADDYITKPFDNRELKARIRIHLRHSRKLKEALQSPDTSTEEADFINPLDRDFMEKMSAIIDKNLDNTEYSVVTLSADMAMSRSSLYNKLKAIAGQSPNDYIRLHRLRKAAELLKKRKYTIVEIAYMTGFADTKYFATVFKKQFGITPSAYAKGEKP